MDQQAARELWNASAIHSVKLLTSNKSMKGIYFFRVLDVPTRIKLSEIMRNLQKEAKMNFITFFHEGMPSKELRNIYFGCRYSHEYFALINDRETLKIRGYTLRIEESRKALEFNLVKVTKEMENDVWDLPKVLSFNASSSYSLAFPSERLMEILVEFSANVILESRIKGIFLKYSHHSRELAPKIIMMVSNETSFDEISAFLKDYGNTSVERRSTRGILSFKTIWERENSCDVNEYDEPIFSLTRAILSKDVISREWNFNNIRAVLD